MQHEIDDLAISFATGRSRRDALKKLALGAFGVPVAVLGGLGLTGAEAAKNDKKNKKNNKDNTKGKKSGKKNDTKKITLCHNGQTITVSKKAKKKHLRHGDTVGPCPETPGCTPETNPCGNRKCGSVDNGCNQQVSCGNCTAPEICTTTTGQCGCTPNQNPCGNRKCGSVDNGCNQQVSCGNCTSPEVCNTNTGQCGCTPNANPCAGRECGTVDNGCGEQVNCGSCTNAITNCQERICTDGQCGVSNLPPDTTCDDGNACTTGTTCQNGVCGGGTSVTCDNPPSVCQVSTGACDPTTGDCQYQDLPNDTPCGMNKCNNTCQNGTCVNSPVVCPGANECNSACDPNTGSCRATPEPRRQGEACSNGTGMCVDGACEVTNTGTTICTGVNPCLAPTFCDTSQSCICYSTVEGAGFCIDRTQAICPAEDVRPACSSSDECADTSVCVPLKETPESTESCCGAGRQFPGFCVPLSARCQAP